MSRVLDDGGVPWEASLLEGDDTTKQIFQFCDCGWDQIVSLVPELRKIDPLDVDASTQYAPHVLAVMWRQASIRRAALASHAVVAVWGCRAGNGKGCPWLFANPAFEPLPETVVLQIRGEFNAWLRIWPGLEIDVVPDSERAYQFFGAAGFTIVGEFMTGGKSFLKMRLGADSLISAHSIGAI
jgi:hypothetical protein